MSAVYFVAIDSFGKQHLLSEHVWCRQEIINVASMFTHAGSGHGVGFLPVLLFSAQYLKN